MINNSLFVLLLKFFVYPSSANLQPWLFPLVCMVQKTDFRTIIFTSAFFGKVQYPHELSRKFCNSAEEAGLFHPWRKTEIISIMYSWLSISWNLELFVSGTNVLVPWQTNKASQTTTWYLELSISGTVFDPLESLRYWKSTVYIYICTTVPVWKCTSPRISFLLILVTPGERIRSCYAHNDHEQECLFLAIWLCWARKEPLGVLNGNNAMI